MTLQAGCSRLAAQAMRHAAPLPLPQRKPVSQPAEAADPADPAITFSVQRSPISISGAACSSGNSRM